jgi:hypothetical protein
MVSRADRKSKKERYRLLQELVGEIIRESDPERLLAGGAPPDEYDGEIARILPYVRHIQSAADAASVVAGVFESAFGRNNSSEAYAAVGELLFSALREHGFVR